MQIAKLAKHVTSDGLCSVRDEVPIGTVYTVDVDSICELEWGNEGSSVVTARQSIHASASATGRDGWLPLELLEML